MEVTENNVWIDDTFRVSQERWGSWVSRDKEENKLVTSYSEDLCIAATRFYLKGKQEGFPDSPVSYDSYVGGKL